MSAFVEAFGHLLHQADVLGASDVHIEPMVAGLQVRMRVDGVLRVVHRIDDPDQQRRLFEVVKRQCQLDLGRLGVPQDVRFGTDDPACDYRVALVPGLMGEKVVLRRLSRTTTFDLAAYPMPAAAKADLTDALGKRDGLVVVSGPTGSGKTTLLYNALSSLDPRAQMIYTLEDPVEYQLDGLWQCQVDRDRGVGFAELLRALMRADPDVVLVGEIRDPETAKAAMHAAKTGHLVLTTVHANDTVGIVDRLEDLGVSRVEYASTVRFASAQRLLPRVCAACRVPDPEGLQRLEAAFGAAAAAFTGAGCEACEGLGSVGRVLQMGWQRREVAGDGRSSLRQVTTLRASALAAAEQGVVRAVDAAGY